MPSRPYMYTEDPVDNLQRNPFPGFSSLPPSPIEQKARRSRRLLACTLDSVIMSVFDTIERVTTSPTLFLLVSSLVLSAAYVILHTWFRRLPANAPPAVSDDFPITGAIRFWTKRWDFVRRARDQTSTGNFSFHAGPNTIVALNGDAGRKLFFESRDLGFQEGCVIRSSNCRIGGARDMLTE